MRKILFILKIPSQSLRYATVFLLSFSRDLSPEDKERLAWLDEILEKIKDTSSKITDPNLSVKPMKYDIAIYDNWTHPFLQSWGFDLLKLEKYTGYNYIPKKEDEDMEVIFLDLGDKSNQLMEELLYEYIRTPNRHPEDSSFNITQQSSALVA